MLVLMPRNETLFSNMLFSNVKKCEGDKPNVDDF